jgi:2-dehydro-3-deoxygalactonokinase
VVAVSFVSTAAGSATDITTYMTGELFSLLADQSILAASILPGGGNEKENGNAFQQGVTTAQGRSLSQNLFLVRTNQLFNRFSKQANFHFLSGLLIGAELEVLSKKQVDSIILSGEKKLLRNYLTAFETLGIQAAVRTVDAAAATIRGQLAVYRRFYE